ncbi:MAG: hypothetical protein WBD71_16990 [Xanthobacteraceae bacterium]
MMTTFTAIATAHPLIVVLTVSHDSLFRQPLMCSGTTAAASLFAVYRHLKFNLNTIARKRLPKAIARRGLAPRHGAPLRLNDYDLSKTALARRPAAPQTFPSCARRLRIDACRTDAKSRLNLHGLNFRAFESGDPVCRPIRLSLSAIAYPPGLRCRPF